MSNAATTIAGAALAATGVAHFVAPNAFRAITVAAFPDDTDAWIQRNGAIETAVGIAVAVPQTRKVGLAALGAYGAWLAFNVVRHR